MILCHDTVEMCLKLELTGKHQENKGKICCQARKKPKLSFSCNSNIIIGNIVRNLSIKFSCHSPDLY